MHPIDSGTTLTTSGSWVRRPGTTAARNEHDLPGMGPGICGIEPKVLQAERGVGSFGNSGIETRGLAIDLYPLGLTARDGA